MSVPDATDVIAILKATTVLVNEATPGPFESEYLSPFHRITAVNGFRIADVYDATEEDVRLFCAARTALPFLLQLTAQSFTRLNTVADAVDTMSSKIVGNMWAIQKADGSLVVATGDTQPLFFTNEQQALDEIELDERVVTLNVLMN